MFKLGLKAPAYQPPPKEAAEASIAVSRAEVFKLEGDLSDQENYSKFEEPLLKLAGEKPLIVDASDVTALGYQFSRTLISANRAQEHAFGYDNSLRLVVKDPQIVQTLLTTGLGTLFRVYSTLEDAHIDTGRITAKKADLTK